MACRSSGRSRMWFGSGNSLRADATSWSCWSVIERKVTGSTTSRPSGGNMGSSISIGLPSRTAEVRLPRYGSAFVDESAQTQARALLARRGSPRCGVPVISMFIGYDGYYYLCSHDWEKVSSHGHVFEQRIVDAIRSRLRHVASRGAPCRTCNFDPVNRVAAALVEAGVEAAQHEADNAQKRWAIVRSSAELNAVLQADPETVALAGPAVTTLAGQSPALRRSPS